MPVFLEVESRLNRSSIDLAAREIRSVFDALGKDVSKGLSRSFSGFSTSEARRELLAMQNEYRKLADAELEAARIATRSAREVEVANLRAAEATAKWGAASSQAAKAQVVLADAQARASRDMRANADAVVASEAAHRKLNDATADAAGATAAASRIFNGIGVASVAAYSAAVFETTKRAGDFQASQIKLQTSAGESAQNLKLVSDGLLKMAGQVGYSAQELSRGMYIVESGGYHGADGLKVMQAAAQGAKAEQADLTTVNNALTTSLHDFGFNANQAADVMSKMIVAVGSGKTTIQDFAGALHSVEPAAAAAHIKLEDVYGTLAMLTQSGESAEQATENMRNAINSLAQPTSQQREAMTQFGVSADNVSQNLGVRGLAGTMQYLSEAILKHMDPSGKISVSQLNQNAQAASNAAAMLGQMSPAARQASESFMHGAMGSRAYTMAIRAANNEDSAKMKQFLALENQVNGFSKRFANGKDIIETYNAALKDVTGTVAGQTVALQVTGEHAEATNALIKQLTDTTREHDGTVKGFNESQSTLNAKMADAKAAFGAAAIEIGSAFIPVMTDVANIAKDVGDAMAKHPGITHAVVDALGVLGGAWLTFKAINIVSTILSPITTALGTMAEAEGVAATAAGGLRGALSMLGPAAAGIAIGKPLADATLHSDVIQNAMADNPLGHNPISEWINQHTPSWLGGDVVDSNGDVKHRAGGGPLHASGPKGHDSALFWGADGEHVLTHHEVQKMGGHSGVYAFRQSLMGGTILGRAPGGPIGSDPGSGTPAVPLVQNPNGTWTSPNPAWAHLIARESSGINQRQGIIDVNSGGNEAEGLFQITPATWRSHGGGQFAPNALSATPQQQAIIAASILRSNPSGSDWGAGLPGRENASALLSGLGPAASWPKGSASDPIYTVMPPNSRPGTGPLGQPGYYTPNPERVSSAVERLRHLDAEIATAEKRRSELRADAKQSEKDRLDEEIRHLKIERDQAARKLGEAQQGSFHSMGRGRRGGMGGSPFLPVPLADKFGLDKGLPGLAEWAVGFLEDLVLGPMETAAWAAFTGGMGDDGALGALPGGPLGGADFAGALGAPSGGGSVEGPSGGYSASPANSGSGGVAGPGVTSSGSPFAGLSGSSGTPGAGPSPAGAQPLPTDIGDQILRQQFIDAFKFQRTGPTHFDPNSLLGPGASGQLFGPSTGGMRGQQLRDAFARPPAPTPDQIRQLPGPWSAGHFATGGPVGNDTIPAWLSPGEFVMNTQATNQFLPQLQAMNAQYFDEGSNQPIGPQPQNAASPKPPAPPKPPGPRGLPPPGGQPQPGQQAPGGPPQPGGMGVDIHQDRDKLATPGKDIHELGSDLGPMPGIGFSGGIIGAAEGAASSGADVFAPGSGAAMQVGFQELNRAAAYGAQVAGISVEGILESLIPGGSGGSDWSKTIPGRLLMGVAGVRPSQNTAGQTQLPMQGGGQPDQQYSGMGMQGPTAGGVNFHGPVTVQANDAHQFMESMNHEATMAGGMYPTSGNVTGPGGGR